MRDIYFSLPLKKNSIKPKIIYTLFLDYETLSNMKMTVIFELLECLYVEIYVHALIFISLNALLQGTSTYFTG